MPAYRPASLCLYLFLSLFAFSAGADWCQDASPTELFTQEAPEGLIVRGSAHDHERDTAARFAQFLKGEDNCLILASALDGVDTPGFDAVVLDEARTPFANVSFKRTKWTDAENLSSLAGKAFRKMNVYSRCGAWQRLYAGLTRTSNRAQAATVERAVRELTALYAPGELRRRWLVIDSETAPEIHASVLNYLAGEITKRFDDRRIFVLNAGRIIEMHKGQWWPVGPCGDQIKSPQI